MKNKLKIHVLILLSVVSLSLNAQTTWVKTQNLDVFLPAQNHDSTGVGPKEICMTANATVISIIQINQNGDMNIIAMDSLGNIKWNRVASHVGGIFSESCFDLHPTPDNGCVYILQHLDPPGDYRTIFRLDSSGTVRWSKTFMFLSTFLPEYCIPTYQSTFLMNINDDSLVELDDNGNFIRQRSPFSGQISVLPDTEFIVSNPSLITREYFNGAQSWSLNTISNSVFHANATFIYTRLPSSIMKINTTDGSIAWTKSIINTKAAAADDGEFVLTDATGNQITWCDSTGLIKWTKNFVFPDYDFTSIFAYPDKTCIMGGCWRNSILNYPFDFGYSPFMMRIDSSGNGVIDSTDYFFIGNANDNNQLGFGDDAVYIAAAMNNTGPPRDSLLRNVRDMNVFATDWPDSFLCGGNYKFSDYDGNGIIDTADVRKLSEEELFNNYAVTPHWLRLTSLNAFPDLKFSFDTSTADTIKINVIMGSPLVPVDSIYGISFQCSLINRYPPLIFSSINYSLTPTSLGDTNTNLYCYEKVASPFNTIEMVLCRTDHQNVSVAGDTIVTLNFVHGSPLNQSDTIFLFIVQDAISTDGCPLTMNLTTDTLFLQGNIGIDNVENTFISISPLPADERITFSFGNSNTTEIMIFDTSGKFIYSVKNPGKDYILNTRNYNDGIYFVSVNVSGRIFKSKFIVMHG